MSKANIFYKNITQPIKIDIFNFGHNLAKDKFNEIKDYCVRKNIKCNLESKNKLNSSTIILLNIYFDEDKFINEKDFFIKIVSTRFFIYIE